VKYVIEKSSTKPGQKAYDPGTHEEADFGTLSRSGGIINAYEAIKLASTLKGERPKTVTPKTTVKPKKKA